MRTILSFVSLLVTIPFLSFGQTPVLLYSQNFDTSSLGSDTVIGNDLSNCTYQSGYDYSADSIPAAPNGTGTLGLRTQCNIGNVSGGEIDGLNIYVPTDVPGNRFKVQVDIWLNYGSSGTTEHAGLGIGGSGTKVNSIHSYGGLPTDTDGLTFGYNGDNGELISALFWVLGSPSGQTDVGTWANTSKTTPLGQFTSDPPYDSVANNGQYGMQWTTVTITDLNGNITVDANGLQLATYFNDTVNASGHDYIYLMHTDPFASIGSPTAQSFCLFDNLKVYTIPAPLAAKDWTLYE